MNCADWASPGFAAPFAAPQGSAIRELFRHMATPGMISFAGGYPSPDLFDRDGLDAAARAAWAGQAGDCLQYGATEGLPALREALAQHMRRQHGMDAQPGDLLVSTGSQQAFALLLRVLVSPGDTVVVEQPTYTAALQALRLAGAHCLPVPMDADGMDVAALARQLDALPSQARPKLIYTVPTFANPSGTTLPLARRRQLAALAAHHRIVLVEDDPYSALRFAGEPVPSLWTLSRRDVPHAAPWTVYLGSLSKIVAPGLRIGWMHASPDILRRCAIAKQVDDLCTPPWLQAVAACYLGLDRLDAQIARMADAYRMRAQRMMASLRDRLGERLAFSEPAGGMFLWAHWRDGADATDMLRRAIAHKVMYVPGAPFFAGTPDVACLRLCFSMSSPDDIAQGVARLASAVA